MGDKLDAFMEVLVALIALPFVLVLFIANLFAWAGLIAMNEIKRLMRGASP